MVQLAADAFYAPLPVRQKNIATDFRRDVSNLLRVSRHADVIFRHIEYVSGSQGPVWQRIGRKRHAGLPVC